MRGPRGAMSDAEVKKTQVDLAGLMEVLGKSLYSTPVVAIRELVQNAHDSCTRRRLESKEPFEPLIIVEPDAARGVLAIEDRGAGLTKDEIERYLATVGAGYTKKLRADHKEAGLIGQFGLGFLSAFIVSERIELFTTSFQEPAKGWQFSSRSGESYLVRPIEPRPIGTRVELSLTQAFRELASVETVRSLLLRYCSLLTVPIRCGEGPPVNEAPPPWRLRDLAPIRKKRLSLDFAKRFERVFEPICTIELPEREEGPRAHGIVWIQDGATYGTSDNRNVSLFVRGMLVSEDERDLLPAYAGFAGAVLESDDLSPTASREDVQKDAAYLEVARRVRDALIEGLERLARSEAEAWRRILSRHNEALLGAALCDERLFELLAKELRLPTTEGDLTAEQIAKRGEGKIHVSIQDQGGYEETLFRALGVPVVIGTRYAALPFAARYAERYGSKLVRLGTKEGNDALFRREALPPEQQDLLRELLGEEGIEVVPAHFRPDYLPLVLIPDREVLLKERLEADEADRRVSSALLGMARLYTQKIENRARARLFVNLDSEPIRRLLSTKGPSPRRDHAAALLRSISRLMASRGDEAVETDLSRTLSECSAAICAVLEG
jgi:molecular chaperone HtpG